MSRIALALTLSITFFAPPVLGEISPGNVAKMRKAASHVLEVEVVDVQLLDAVAVRETKHKVIVTAKVTGVERSDGAPKVAEKIEIESYRLAEAGTADELALLEELIGPSQPPEIKAGWKGKIYLKKADATGEINRYKIAVFGHSFVPAKADANTTKEGE